MQHLSTEMGKLNIYHCLYSNHCDQVISCKTKAKYSVRSNVSFEFRFENQTDEIDHMAENLPYRNIYVAYICTFLSDSKKTVMPVIIYACMCV